jgi:hypothetical protein
MCTIVNLKATQEAKKNGLNYAWRVHRICQDELKTSPWQDTPIHNKNNVAVAATVVEGDVLTIGAFHCTRTRKLARLLKKYLLSASWFFGKQKYVIEKVYFKTGDIVAVGTNDRETKLGFSFGFGMSVEVNENICVSRFVLNEKDV